MVETYLDLSYAGNEGYITLDSNVSYTIPSIPTLIAPPDNTLYDENTTSVTLYAQGGVGHSNIYDIEMYSTLEEY